MPQPVILWFRRDLRLQDNIAVYHAIQTQRPIIPLFIFDPAILKSKRLGIPRLKFMLQALEALNSELQQYERQLLIRHGNPPDVLQALIAESDADKLFFNLDYTPYARQRDQLVEQTLNIQVQTFHDRLLVKPDEIAKKDGKPYIVYTPFMKQWRNRFKPEQVDTNNLTHNQLHSLDGLQNDGIPKLNDLNFSCDIDVPEASETHTNSILETFLNNSIYAYADERNILGNPSKSPKTHTSFLSPYIRFGLLSLRQIYWSARETYDKTENENQQESVKTFINEIIWHEFYTHILYHFPKVKTQNFYAKYDKISWVNNCDDFEAWKQGRTGYPIVDAAMRQLLHTGWMHNRARMIVASFLTKDLLVDWRWGELHFMHYLLDGDLAANNGGWQWAAGTGTDAQPYFRVFNPVSQSKKFDPSGAFIRHWIPELRDVPDKYIHEPWKMDTPPADYPSPIVDHAEARKRAIDIYKQATSNDIPKE